MLTTSKILGKWKAVSIEVKGDHFSVFDEASLTRALFATSKREIMGGEDSTLFKATAKMLSNMLSDMHFDFKNGDTVNVSMRLTGGREAETKREALHYTLNNDKLSLDWSDGQAEVIELSMPDRETLVFINFTAAGGKNLVFKRQ